MRRYVIRRLLQAVLILFMLSIGLFALIHAIPGGPERVFLAPHQTEAAREAIIHNLGLDQPAPYPILGIGSKARLHGDFGVSFTDNQPVASDIFSRLPATLELFAAALSPSRSSSRSSLASSPLSDNTPLPTTLSPFSRTWESRCQCSGSR